MYTVRTKHSLESLVRAISKATEIFGDVSVYEREYLDDEKSKTKTYTHWYVGVVFGLPNVMCLNSRCDSKAEAIDQVAAGVQCWAVYNGLYIERRFGTWVVEKT